MSTTADKLEDLFARVRRLPEARQELAIEMLSQIAGESVYRLSDDELAVLAPALDRARRGEFASEAEVDEALNTPWS
jgi:hypothetical protein